MRIRETLEYREWITSLRDVVGKAKIQVRVDRLVHGNPGSHRSLANGVTELKIDFGPGYRVYYSTLGNELVLLLAGGDKSTQQADIRKAKALVKNYEGLP